MRQVTAIVAAIGGLFLSTPSLAALPVLQPNSPWQREQTQLCSYIRNFSGPDGPALLKLSSIPMMEPFGFRIFTSTSRPGEWRGAATIRLLSTTRTIRGHYQALTYDGKWRQSVDIFVDRADWPAIKEASDLKIDATVLFKAELATPGLADGVALLRECNAALLESWGFSRADQARVATPPSINKNVGSFLRDSDYPRDVAEEGISGQSFYRLNLDARGQIQNCAVVGSSGNAALDSRGCEVFMSRRPLMQPALDRAGRPIASPFVTSIQWFSSVPY